MNKEEYFQLLFGSEQDPEARKKRIEEAFKLAVDARKFEIELYWKRASYFWTFIAATFTGYGLTYQPQLDCKTQALSNGNLEFLAFFLACFGFLLSFAWYFVNRGSKQWQENWEIHVNYLADEITGPLYKTVLRRSPPSIKNIGPWLDFIVLGSSKHSVTKINQLVSLYITLMWAVIVWNTQSNWSICKWSTIEQLVLAFTAFAAVGIAVFARPPSKGFGYTTNRQDSIVVD